MIKEAERNCKAYLWKGSDPSPKGAKVKWSTACLPKKEGGLGLKDLLTWNEACAMRFIWKGRSLWIAWMATYMLKGQNLGSLPLK